VGRVLHLFRAPKSGASMEEISAVRVVENAGFEGCAHARPNGRRQVLLVDVETLQKFELVPGVTRENITTQGIDVNALTVGQRLRIGGVELVVSLVCEPCEQIEALRAGLQESMVGQRGMLCKVLCGGTLKVGDGIELV
jgi:MOSC domain-containing protein YiiM